MSESIVKFAKRIREAQRGWRHRNRVSSITKLLSVQTQPDTQPSENDFDILQSRYPKRPEYGYDLSSLFERAASRAIDIHRLANPGDARLKILEIGPGDGMLGALFAAADHDVTLCDLEDWRTDAAKYLHFIAANCCEGMPFKTGEFDVVCSFNSFEHFEDPTQVFIEAVRVTKSGGLMHFDFGPLYCSPWGLHAYRSLKMPYPQFLFSEEFIRTKLAALGIWDLGQKRTELQSLNRWRPAQFASLWRREGCEIVNCRQYLDESNLGLVFEYPAAFRGRGLTFDDVTCSSISVSIRKI